MLRFNWDYLVYFISDIQISKFRTSNRKLDFNKFKRVPLPEEFHNHIVNNQLNHKQVKNSPEILKIYEEILLH